MVSAMGTSRVRAHFWALSLCLLGTLAGALLIGAAIHGGGAAEDRFLKCYGGQRLDLAVLPAETATSTRPQLPWPSIKQVAAVDGVASVRAILGGPVRVKTEGSSPAEAQATVLPAGGLPLIRVIDGALPTRPDEAVLDEVTAKTLVVHVGSTVIADDKSGRPVHLRLSGIVDVDMNQDLLYRGVLGVSPELAHRLVGRLTVGGLEVTLDPEQVPGPVRQRIAQAVGARYSVLTLQDVIAHRTDVQVLTLALATLGVTSLLASMATSSTTSGRIQDTLKLDASRIIAKYGAHEIRKVLVFDRVIGLIAAIIAGIALTAGILVLLSIMGADLPCTSVYSISVLTVVLPVVVFAVAISTAPVVALMRKWRHPPENTDEHKHTSEP